MFPRPKLAFNESYRIYSYKVDKKKFLVYFMNII